MNASTAPFTNETTATTIGDISRRSLSDNDMLLIGVAFGIAWNFGLAANVITLVELCKLKQKPLNVIKMALCCSDIISILVSPFVVKQIFSLAANEDYPWNRLLCKTLIPVQNITSGVTIQLVLALSIWRLYAIQDPIKSINFMKLRSAKTLVISVWLTVTAVSLSAGSYYLDIIPSARAYKQICFVKRSAMTIATLHYFIDTLLMTLLPVSVIVILCISTAVSLNRQNMKRQKISGNQGFREEEKKALVQLAAIISVFLVGYIPKVAFGIWDVAGRWSPRSKVLAFLASRWIMNFTESINPIIYNIGSEDLRRSMKKTLRLSSCDCVLGRKTVSKERSVPSIENQGNAKKEYQEPSV